MSLLDTYLIHRMAVYGKTDTQSRSGGDKRAPVLVKDKVPCRVEDLSVMQQLINMSRGINITHTIFTEYDGVRNGQTLVVDEITYRVVGIRKRRQTGLFSNIPTYHRIEALEIADG
jgi:hypothetical protein